MVMSQTSGFSQQGKVTHEMKDEGYSIAHSSLPLNSKARIANTSTGKELEVTVTRLIPASQNRIADVSSDVWKELEFAAGNDARIYTVVTAKPQVTAPTIIASQTTTPQTTASQTATSQTAMPQTAAPQVIVSPGSQGYAAGSQGYAAGSQGYAAGSQGSGANVAQAGTGSGALGDLPSGIKFENNNNFIINGNPMTPSAVAPETITQQPAKPAVTYYQPPAQPSVSYQQPAQPSYQQPAQPAVTYARTQPSQPSSDIWTQLIKPAAQPSTAFEAPLPAAAFDMKPAKPSNVTYYEAPRPVQPSVNVQNWTQPLAPLAQPNPSAVVYNSGRQQTQPSVVIENWQQQPSETRAQQAQPLVTYNIQTHTVPLIPAEKKLPEIQTNKISEIVSPATRTFVFVDSSPDTPVPSVTVNNGAQSYRSVLDEQGKK